MSSGGDQASRLAWMSLGLNIILSLVNTAVAFTSGSLAVAAELLHNLTDLAASIAVLVGIHMSRRRSRAFPYGLHKVENVVASGVAILIFVSASEIAGQALRGSTEIPRVNLWTLAGVAVSALLPWLFSRYLMRHALVLNSPSLIASAREYQVHMFSSGLVLVALLSHSIGYALDRLAALLIVVLIVRTGWELMSDAMRVLLDASLDRDVLEQVQGILAADPAVSAVRSVVGRNAGRFRFIEAELELRASDLGKAHLVTERLESAIRAAVPHVERVLLHPEPSSRADVRYAVPLADQTGVVSEHFGESPWFAVVTVQRDSGQQLEQRILANPHSQEERAKGIRVAEWLVSEKIDVVLLRESLTGKGPAYVLSDAGVTVRNTRAATVSAALAEEGRATGSNGEER